jgi:signal peptidase I
VLLCVVLWCVLSTAVVHQFLYSSFHVLGASMAPTLREGDWRLVNRWRHQLFGAQQGDLALIRDPESHTHVVKRLIGLPGDVVQILPDGVYVNYRKLYEPYVAPNGYTWSRKMESRPLPLGEYQYFVMGDNRLTSVDSRWYGPVHASQILGLVAD